MKNSTQIDHYHFKDKYESSKLLSSDSGNQLHQMVLLNRFLDLKNDSVQTDLKKYFTSRILKEEKVHSITKYFNFKFLKIQQSSFANLLICEPVYRDIFVFKQNQKTIGIAKVCFGCGHNFIMIGDNIYEDINLDYDKLQKDIEIRPAANRR